MSNKRNHRERGNIMKLKRKDTILQLLAENRIMKAGEFAELFQVSMETIRRDLNELIERMSTIESRPARKYEHIINAVITAVIAAAVSFIMK